MTDFTSSHWLWTILWTQKWLVEFPICTASTSRSSKSEKNSSIAYSMWVVVKMLVPASGTIPHSGWGAHLWCILFLG